MQQPEISIHPLIGRLHCLNPCGDGSIDVKGTEVNSVNSLKVKHFRVFGQPSEGCLDTRIFLLREYINWC